MKPLRSILTVVFIGILLCATSSQVLAQTMTPTPSPTPTPSCIPEWCWLQRDLPDICHAGESFEVALEIQGGTAAIVEVMEVVPDGWEILSPAWDYHDGNVYVWNSWITGYVVQPPADAVPGSYCFWGETTSYHWCNGYVYLSITGESCVNLDLGVTPTPTETPLDETPTFTPYVTNTPSPTPSCIPEWCWLERNLPDICHAGESFEVALEIQGGTAAIVEVMEVVPDGWEILSPAWDYHDGNVYVWNSWITGYVVQPPADAVPGSYCFWGETTSYHWCNGYVYLSITGESCVNLDLGATPTPTETPFDETPTFTPYATNTPTPTVTPDSCSRTAVEIWMPETFFRPGDRCACHAVVCNSEGFTLMDYPLFVILDLNDSLYFAPGFNDFDFYRNEFPEGDTRIEVLSDFYWPEGAGSMTGARWYGALTNPEITALIGELGTFTFGWGSD